MKNILLHTCCAPCACYPIKELRNQGFKITLFYYNPNIHPVSEYRARLNELKKYLDKMPEVQLIQGEYENKIWFELVRGLENEPEGGKRCGICYAMRLKKTADLAKTKNFDYFASTLSISPHKKTNRINELANKLAQELGIKFFERDWKKMDGFKRACEISKKENFYRQNYCGCIYSKKYK
jgi:predicted adenine nucleotide alpha hydrolase (AANH) superfamily ATPase